MNVCRNIQRNLSTEELMLLNFGVWRFLRVLWTARRSNQSLLKETSPDIHWKDWWWSWNSNTLATWCEELTHFKRPWCWERSKAGGDGWMASLTQWTWVWGNSGSWWWTGRPGVLQSMGSHRVGHDWWLNWTELKGPKMLFMRKWKQASNACEWKLKICDLCFCNSGKFATLLSARISFT